MSAAGGTAARARKTGLLQCPLSASICSDALRKESSHARRSLETGRFGGRRCGVAFEVLFAKGVFPALMANGRPRARAFRIAFRSTFGAVFLQ